MAYIFSDLGIAEWPIALDPLESEQLASVRIPALPSDVALLPNRPDPRRGKQVVLRADDTGGAVVIEAYENGIHEAVLSERRRLPD